MATITGLVDLPLLLIFLLVIGYLGGAGYCAGDLYSVGHALCTAYSGALRKAVESTFRASAQKGAMLVESLTA